MLEPAGLTNDEEKAYLFLLDYPGSSSADIGASTGLGGAELKRLLTSLERNGLVSKAAGRGAGYLPARPDLALEVLVTRREEELKRARLSAAALLDRFRKGIEIHGQADFVEIISGRAAYAQRFLQMQRGAVKELVCFNKPPYVSTAEDCREAELDRLREGVLQRGIYERASLENPGTFESICELARNGEAVRLTARVPVKLSIVDRRLALIPLLISDHRLEGVLVHPSPLLDALIALFESVWAQSQPFRLGASIPDAEADALSGEDQSILALLAAGVQDKAISRQLDISDSSLQRRLKRLFGFLGADSRFQAGAEAARRELI